LQISRACRFHLDTLRVAEVVPHLGMPVRGQIRQPVLRKSKPPPGPGGPIPAVLGPIFGVPVRGSGGLQISRTLVRTSVAFWVHGHGGKARISHATPRRVAAVAPRRPGARHEPTKPKCGRGLGGYKDMLLCCFIGFGGPPPGPPPRAWGAKRPPPSAKLLIAHSGMHVFVVLFRVA
jgi:hypothetical protein